jgi:hypothetical protein
MQEEAAKKRKAGKAVKKAADAPMETVVLE